MDQNRDTSANESKTDECQANASTSEIVLETKNDSEDNEAKASISQSQPHLIPNVKIARLRHESGNTGDVSGSGSADEKNLLSTPDGKRQRATPGINTPQTSSPIAMALFPNSIPASPPKFVSLEEIMQAANGVENLVLAHEIAVDQNFKLEKVEPPRNSLEGQVKEVLHRAFWDVLAAQLKESPTNFDQAMILLEEVKTNVLSLLLPQHTRLKQEIEEILDLDLILQQAENGILDFQRYAQYILSVCARLCAPVRDETIRELTQENDVIKIFRGIMELLDLMKLDMANFHIQQIRPQIQQKSVEYERQKFQDFLDTQKKHSGVDGLLFTKNWLKRNCESLDLSSENNSQMIFNKVLNTSYLELLIMNNYNHDDAIFLETFPETLLIDVNRFKSLREHVFKCTIIGSVLLITFATVGPSIQGLQEFRETFKKHLTLVLSDIKQGQKEEEMRTHLKAAAVQVVEEVGKCLDKHGFAPLDDAKKSLLSTQIVDVEKNDNRVRKVVERRITEFLEGILSSPTAQPMQIPAGLSLLQSELSSLAGQLMRIVTHNKSVFKEYYSDIISQFNPKISSQSTDMSHSSSHDN